METYMLLLKILSCVRWTIEANPFLRSTLKSAHWEICCVCVYVRVREDKKNLLITDQGKMSAGFFPLHPAASDQY